MCPIRTRIVDVDDDDPGRIADFLRTLECPPVSEALLAH
jgi:hypothetical protein